MAKRSKKTVIIGASPNPQRYSNIATKKLLKYGHEVLPLGIRKGEISDVDIILEKPLFTDVDTVTLYVGPARQGEWIDYIFSLNPKRIIFNPGTENPDFKKKATEKGIEATEACTLVLLSLDTY